MKTLKTMRAYAAVLLCVLSVASCNGNKTDKVDEAEIALSAHVSSLGAGENFWGEAAEIGVFALEKGTDKVLSEAGNVKYTTILSTGIMTLSPAGKGITIKNNGMSIDIAGYYPYTQSLVSVGESQHICKVDMSDQAAPKPGMLMTARANEMNSVMNTGTLALTPILAKLGITLTIKTTKADAHEPRVYVKGVSATADVDVLTGQYVSYGTAADVELLMANQNLYYYEALLPAQNIADAAELVVNLTSGSPVSLKLKESLAEIKPNRQYDIEVTVSPDGIKATLVQVSDLNVIGWKEDSETINGNTD